jgi:fibronectin-binding autotransporter adhesin
MFLHYLPSQTRCVHNWRSTLKYELLLGAIIAFAARPVCFAQTFWTDGIGNWNTAGNWSLGVPNSASGNAFDAVIENGGTAQLLGPPDGSVRRLRIGRAAGAGNVLVDAAMLTDTQDVYVNENGTATSSMTVRNGSTVNAPTTSIGQSSAAASNFTISGPFTSYNVGTQFILGNAGAGLASLTIDGGGLLYGGSALIANSSGTTAIATIHNPGSTWGTTGAFTIGSSGTGTLNITDSGEVYVGTSLSINGTSTINLNGGTLRLNTVSAGLNRLNYTAGTIQLAGDRDFKSDSTISTIFGANPTVPSGKQLTVEGQSTFNGKTLAVTSGTFVSQGALNIVWDSITGTGALLQVTNSGKATASGAAVIQDSSATITDPGSNWTIGGDLLVGPVFEGGSLSVSNQGTVYISGSLILNTQYTDLHVTGGTLRFNGYARNASASVIYSAGTIQLAGDRTTGSDFAVTDFFGASPVIPAGKSLVVEGTATIASTAPVTLTGGNLTAGTLFLSPGARLTITAAALVAGPIIASAGSLIDATGADLTIGDSTKVNGFYSDGTVKVGAHVVTLADSNDAVFDSGSLVTVGNGPTAGTLNAANGLTLDFGGNITGTGVITTPNNIAKPLINNGHITGNSVAQPIQLQGYVKGVGTFDNVNFTGTFSPGLSPTVLTVGNVSLSPTSTLIMELGGTTAGSGYDQIQSSGALAFDGTLQVSLINGFTPTAGQSFNLFDWASASGAFAAMQLPTLSGGLVWNTSQLYTNGVLSVVVAAIPGDYNHNGIVDAADYVVWRKTLGQTGTGLAADGNNDGVVNQTDYDVWRSHFGQTAGNASVASASVAVPEPATLLMMLVGILTMIARRNTFIP